MQFPAWLSTWLAPAAIAVAGITAYVNLERDVGDNTRSIVSAAAAQERKWNEHDEYHREKAIENNGAFTRIDGRISTLEAVPPKVDQIGYRVTVVEQQAVNTSQAIKELQTAVNSQGADLRIVLEILRRMDEKTSGASPAPSRLRLPN